MLTIQAGNLIALATIVGFIADSSLQVFLKTPIGSSSPTGYGLKEYFEQHGKAESPFIAGGMLGLFYILYSLTGLPFTIQNIFIYSILLDLFFRKTGIFPSLNGYYNYFNYFWTAFYAVVPMIIPLLIYKMMAPGTKLF